ncbi:MAG: hypothetical protein K2I74_05715 [Treponemataceae bacterium]|nr:hypothetical protein [Treponemataceae bacterium]
MPWTPKFAGVDYKKRDDFLLSYLKQRPPKNDPAYPAYKVVLAFIVGSVCVRNEYRYVSADAGARLGTHRASYKEKYSSNKELKKLYKDMFTEHPIPVKVIVDYLESLSDDELTDGRLENFAEKVSGLALVTKADNEKLNDAKLKESLPKGVTLAKILSGEKPHIARYIEAEVEIAEFRDDVEA